MIRQLVASVALLASIRCATPGRSVVANPDRDHALTFEHPDECPNPLTESMAWQGIDGSVVEVMDARTFRLRTDQGVLTVSLPNVGEPYDTGARAMLQRMIDGKRVSVMWGHFTDVPSDITGEVHDMNGHEISRQLLRAGAASFVPAPSYTLSGNSECLNRIAEREAKADRLGIWH